MQTNDNLEQCPWCDSENYNEWGNPVRNFISVQCRSCGLIFVKNRLNLDATKKYYENYLSNVHQVNVEYNKQREEMYKLEFDLISSFCRGGNVLDIGCSGGFFLDYFSNAGYKCDGVEFGKKAAVEAAQKYKVYEGEFVTLSIDKKFDLIVFRGVIEHIPFPKAYLHKAIELLNDRGFVYITSTPNSESFCCNLFKELWNQHEPEAHIMHFSTKHFDDFF